MAQEPESNSNFMTMCNSLCEKKIESLGPSLSYRVVEEITFSPDYLRKRGPVYYDCLCGAEHRLWPKKVGYSTYHECKNDQFVKAKKDGQLAKSEFQRLASNEIFETARAVVHKKTIKSAQVALVEQTHWAFDCFHYGMWQQSHFFKKWSMHLVRCHKNIFTIVSSAGVAGETMDNKTAKEIFKQNGLGFIFDSEYCPVDRKIGWSGGYFPRNKYGGRASETFKEVNEDGFYEDGDPIKFGEINMGIKIL